LNVPSVQIEQKVILISESNLKIFGGGQQCRGGRRDSAFFPNRVMQIFSKWSNEMKQQTKVFFDKLNKDIHRIAHFRF
jgi:hypothetical protein